MYPRYALLVKLMFKMFRFILHDLFFFIFQVWLIILLFFFRIEIPKLWCLYVEINVRKITYLFRLSDCVLNVANCGDFGMTRIVRPLKWCSRGEILMFWSMVSGMMRRSSEAGKVRATDPRPCPKCGKIYRSAHTLRTHLEDKHTICPGYRCVLCGTVAKSRNSLHSHMSRQHRGISTKDLPVLPMPSPFDPELASKLYMKAGIKVSTFLDCFESTWVFGEV